MRPSKTSAMFPRNFPLTPTTRRPVLWRIPSPWECNRSWHLTGAATGRIRNWRSWDASPSRQRRTGFEASRGRKVAGSATRCGWRRRGGARPGLPGPEVAAAPAAGARVVRTEMATHLYRPRPAEANPVQKSMERSGATTFFRYTHWYTQYLCGLNYTQIRYAINDIMAERVGFEPTVQLPVLRFSRPALSSAQPSLREGTGNGSLTSRPTRQERGCAGKCPAP